MTVYEGRDECRRLNVLKMWEETIGDLERLGLSFVDPDFCNGRDLRASTSRLQLALLKTALLLGVEVKVGVTVGSLDELDGFDVLLLATGFQRKLLKTFADEADVLTELDGAGFQEAPVPDKQSAAIAVVAHFEYSDRTEHAKQWTKYFEAFDWTLQDARGANNPAQLRQMQAQYGLYCIAPKTLEQDGIQLENMVCYRNRGYRKRDAKRGVCLENCLVPPHATRHAPRATRHAPHATRPTPRATRRTPRATRHAPHACGSYEPVTLLPSSRLHAYVCRGSRPPSTSSSRCVPPWSRHCSAGRPARRSSRSGVPRSSRTTPPHSAPSTDRRRARPA